MNTTVRLLCLATSAVVVASVHAQEPGKPAPDPKPAASPASPSAVPPAPVAVAPTEKPEAAKETAKTPPSPSPAPAADTPSTVKAAIDTLRAAAADPRKIFAKPAPTNATQDPAVIAALESTRSIERTLSVIHERFNTMSDSYELRASTDKDLEKVSEEMKPLVKSARSDVANVMQSAQDLFAELPHTKLSLEAASRLYRQRAITYRDPEMRKVTEAMADELERLEMDVPRRMRLTADFILQLTDLHSFLAETDRCLADTAAAMRILSAGTDEPRASVEGVAFRVRIKQYMAALDEYRKKLTEIPPAELEAVAAADGGGETEIPDNDAPTKRPAGTRKPAEKDKPDESGRKPVGPNTVPTSMNRDVFQTDTSHHGQYHDPQGVMPLGFVVLERDGARVSGEIYVNTPQGMGYQKFEGTVTGSSFTLHVTYAGGPLLPISETWQGTFADDKIEGTWYSDQVRGTFVLDYKDKAASAP